MSLESSSCPLGAGGFSAQLRNEQEMKTPRLRTRMNIPKLLWSRFYSGWGRATASISRETCRRPSLPLNKYSLRCAFVPFRVLSVRVPYHILGTCQGTLQNLANYLFPGSTYFLVRDSDLACTRACSPRLTYPCLMNWGPPVCILRRNSASSSGSSSSSGARSAGGSGRFQCRRSR